MLRSSLLHSVLLGALVVGTAAAVSAPSTLGATSQQDCLVADAGAVTGGCATWQVSQAQWPSYQGMSSDEAPYASGDPVQVTPDGALVVSARPGLEAGGPATDWAVAAVDATTGAPVWDRVIAGPEFDVPFDVAHTAGGVTAVTGFTAFEHQPNTLFVNICVPYEEAVATTVGLDTSTGEPLWTVTGTPGGTFGMALSGDERTLYTVGVTGTPDGQATQDCDLDLLVQAIDVATGAVAWERVHDLGGNGYVRGADIALTPSGLVVMGDVTVAGSGSVTDGVVVGLDPASGDVRWSTRIDAGEFTESLSSMALSPDGAAVYVAGASAEAGGSLFSSNNLDGTILLNDMAFLVAGVSTDDGRLLWSTTWDSGTPGPDAASGVAVSPDGTQVYVAGQSTGTNDVELDLATVAFDTADGSVRWTHTLADPGRNLEIAGEVATAPGGTVLVTGYSGATGVGSHSLLIALDPDGTEREVVRFDLEPARVEYTQDIHIDAVRGFLIVSGRTADNLLAGTPLDQNGPTGVEALDLWRYPLDRFTG